MNKTLAIIGSGHLGQQIAHYAIADNHYDKVVFFDDFSNESVVNGMQILGKTDHIQNAFDKKQFDEILIGIGYKHLAVRKHFFEQFSEMIPFGKIIHSSSWVDSTALIKEGCVVYPSCCIDANAIVECNTILNLACTLAHDSIVGKHSFLSPRVAVAGFVKMEELCIIGINSTIIDNITIPPNTQIGAGTVVINSIENSGLYVGNPQRFIR
jgi:sugar O-acyltransferase (sialic acid O-acetyltransferase NeuD family)